MSVDSSSDRPPSTSIRDWIAGWGAEVAAVDFAAGRRRFAPDAVAFGTRADVVVGLDQIASEQWSKVWGNIAEFRFRLEELVVQVADDASLAVAIVPWTSTGFHRDGRPFDRPGRATVVLRRSTAGDPDLEWSAIHTHFSLSPDTPSRTYGNASTDQV